MSDATTADEDGDGWADAIKTEQVPYIGPPQRPKRQHSMPSRSQAKQRWDAWPKWRRGVVGSASVLLGVYVLWTFLFAPTLRGAAADAATAQVNAAYGAEAETLVSTVIVAVDQRVAAAQSALPPVVVVDAALNWLPCSVNLDARGLIGAAGGTDGTKLDPARAQKVSDQAKALLATGVPLTQMRVTLATDGTPMVTGNATGVPLMGACAAAPTPAPAPTATTTPATAVTPPAGSN